MMRPGTLPWFARHELRLAWRDLMRMLTAGKRVPEWVIGLVIAIALSGIHLLAYYVLKPMADAGIVADVATLAIVTGSGLLSWSMMLSQAMESITRAFYARGDLELILSSPASIRRLFAIRIGTIAVSTVMLAALLVAPFINVLAVYDTPKWLAAYGVLAAMGAASTGFAVAVVAALFRLFGPRKTRLIAQVVAAIVGAAFIIGVQAVAIMTTGSLSRFTLFKSDGFLSQAPALDSLAWLPAHAAMGNLIALVIVLAPSLILLVAAILAFAGRFGDYVIAASSVAYGPKLTRRRVAGFRRMSTKRALRHKEWVLLYRDPWLMSQTLMQILYLLPPALLLWRNFGDDIGALAIMVPVLVMAAGQLAGGLAWLAVSGEDAPELVASAPVTGRAIIAAKIEAVFGAVAVLTAPLLIAMAFASTQFALAALLGIAVSAASATTIQFWFRTQAKRSHFGRRQTSSRIATLSEAFSSILWAATAGLAAMGSWFAIVAGSFALLVLGFIRLIRPRQVMAGY
jgi:ABC-2 type transport system permease protein